MGKVSTEVMKDVRFYARSNGGVTLSGGEALAQPHFTIDVLRKSHQYNTIWVYVIEDDSFNLTCTFNDNFRSTGSNPTGKP